MATYNFLDDNGLKELLRSINSYYAAKEAVNEALTALGQDFDTKLSQKESSLLRSIQAVQNSLAADLASEAATRETKDTSLQSAVNTLINDLNQAKQDLRVELTQVVSDEKAQRTSADQVLDSKIFKEITDRETAVSGLSDEVDQKLDQLSRNISSTLKGYIDQQISALDFEGVKDIVLIPEGELLPNPGSESFFYITADHAIHQWVGVSENYPDGWKTLGEDSAAEIAALAERITVLETRASEVQSALTEVDNHFTEIETELETKVNSTAYNSFIESYTAKIQEIDQSVSELADHKLETSTYNDFIESYDTKVQEIDSNFTDIEAGLNSKVNTETYDDFISTYDTKTQEIDQSLSDLTDNKLEASTYNSFIESYTAKTQEIDQSVSDLDQSIAELSGSVENIDQSIIAINTDLDSKISGITVNGDTVPVTDGIAAITITAGGADTELRADFETFKATVNPQLAEFSTHLENYDNPHEVSKADIGLENVDNTSDEDKPISIATQAALDTKVDSTVYEEGLAQKIAYTDIIDDLEHPVSDVPLSANQGVILDAALNEVKSSITTLEAGLVFKGTVPSYNDLPANAQPGFCYQIFSSASDAHHGEIYAMTETGWVQIVASAQDMSSLIASQAEINKIITDYR